MKKTPAFLTIIILFSLLVCTTNGFASGGSTPSQPITYKTEIKVKLLPASSSFTATLNGTYEIVNIDDNTLIPFSSSVKFSTANGKVIVDSNGTLTTSAKGFKINEVTDTETNEVTISKILTAYGVNDVRYRGSFEILPSANGPLLFNRLGIENYLKGVVTSEMPSSWHTEALKAQAIAARSYAYTQILYSKANGGYLEMTVASQVYGGKTKETASGNQAVKATDSLYAVYDNKPIHAFFHSSSGGYTENSENVWTSEVPYLKAVEDPYDKHPGNYHYGWESISQASVLSQKLKLSSNQVLAGVKVVERGPSGAAQQINATIYDKTTKEKTDLAILPKYVSSPDSLRSFFGISLKSIKFNVSADSTVKIKLANGSEMKSDHLVGYQMKTADGNTSYIEDINLPVRTLDASTSVKTAPSTFSFVGDGWGHLLGMSQWGARGMAEAGMTYDQILKHYYTGIEIKKMEL
ncbi:SpoIID/LytB domain-containing protein [Neobacillus sp. D3-1R]|uniref:SpoIID/LytB domain-containing protein n=1 Tax=Neobacillus sp. D3-1R TaxID=3445778 RepID=UPI003FA0DB42